MNEQLAILDRITAAIAVLRERLPLVADYEADLEQAEDILVCLLAATEDD